MQREHTDGERGILKERKRVLGIRLLKKHGWTQERFESKRREQSDKCAICEIGMTFEDKISKTRACTDHEHSIPPKPRDLLCSACNSGIGWFYEKEELLEKAARYLRKWNGKEIDSSPSEAW